MLLVKGTCENSSGGARSFNEQRPQLTCTGHAARASAKLSGSAPELLRGCLLLQQHLACLTDAKGSAKRNPCSVSTVHLGGLRRAEVLFEVLPGQGRPSLYSSFQLILLRVLILEGYPSLSLLTRAAVGQMPRGLWKAPICLLHLDASTCRWNREDEEGCPRERGTARAQAWQPQGAVS